MHEKFLEVGTDLLCISKRDGFFHWVSPAWTRTLGWTAEELTSTPWLWFVHPEDQERTKAEATALAGGAESVQFENRYRTKDGNYRWLSWRTKPADEDGNFYSVAIDITDRKKIEEELQETSQLQKLLLESARDFAIQMVDPEGTIERWYPGAERIFGFSKEEAVGQKTDLIFTPEDRAANMPAKELETALREGCAMDERWHLRKNGERVYISGAVRPLFLPGKRLRGFIKIGRDITERKQMEEALKASRENLESLVASRTARLQESLETMEQFSYSLVHDLRAPLRSMASYAQLLSKDYAEQLDKDGKEYLLRIERSAIRMDALIQDVLAYRKVGQQPAELKKTDLDTLLVHIISENSAFHPPRATLAIKKPLLPVYAHEALLTQCLWNLLSNAIKFVAPGVHPVVHIWTEVRDSRVRLYVQDNGIGIEPRYADKIFGMFERLHSEEQYAGTGIGLPVVRKAVERMGGTVGFTSEPGKGSLFWIELNAAP